MRVVVRIRPPIRKDEMYGEGSEALQVDKERNLLFLLQKEGQGVTEKTKQFVFDRVLWKDSEQVGSGVGVGVGVGSDPILPGILVYRWRFRLSMSLRVRCLASGKWLTRCHTLRSDHLL